jgi:hypothetical protein
MGMALTATTNEQNDKKYVSRWPAQSHLLLRLRGLEEGLVKLLLRLRGLKEGLVKADGFWRVLYGLQGIECIDNGAIGRHLGHIRDFADEQISEAKRRLQRLILIITEVMEYVRWDALYYSFIRPGDRRLAVASTRNMRECTLLGIFVGHHPDFHAATHIATGPARSRPAATFLVADTELRGRPWPRRHGHVENLVLSCFDSFAGISLFQAVITPITR